MKILASSKTLGLIFLAASLILLQGCSDTLVRSDEAVESAPKRARIGTPADSLANTRSGAEDTLAGARAAGQGSRLGASELGQLIIYFDFDQFRIREDMRDRVDQVAQYLLENPNVRIQVEGHCDERGTPEYNIALGHKRAQSVKNYLATLGVATSRVTTLSYGEERPVDPAHNEAAWAKNRRAKFSLLGGFQN